MNWEQRYRLKLTARTSLVFWAGLALAAALLCAPAVRWLDRETGRVVFGFGAEGARVVLGTLAGSMLTFIVFVLSATLIVAPKRQRISILSSGCREARTPRTMRVVSCDIRFAFDARS